jgi:hypothetical protein
VDISSKRENYEDSNWWEFLEQMPFGVSRNMARIVSKYEYNVEAAFESNVAMLIGCTSKWSFSAEITEEELEKIPTLIVADMIGKMNAQYMHRSDEEEAEIKKV